MSWWRYWLWYRLQRRTFITDGDLRILERHFSIRYNNDSGIFSKIERGQRGRRELLPDTGAEGD